MADSSLLGRFSPNSSSPQADPNMLPNGSVGGGIGIGGISVPTVHTLGVDSSPLTAAAVAAIDPYDSRKASPVGKSTPTVTTNHLLSGVASREALSPPHSLRYSTIADNEHEDEGVMINHEGFFPAPIEVEGQVNPLLKNEKGPGHNLSKSSTASQNRSGEGKMSGERGANSPPHTQHLKSGLLQTVGAGGVVWE